MLIFDFVRNWCSNRNIETVPIKGNHEIEATHNPTDNSYE